MLRFESFKFYIEASDCASNQGFKPEEVIEISDEALEIIPKGSMT
jgi:hypothetical protein